MGYFSRKRHSLKQGFPTCGTRTTGGTQRGFRWYAESFCFIKNKKIDVDWKGINKKISKLVCLKKLLTLLCQK